MRRGRDRLGAQLRRGRAERIGDLQGMATLHALATLRTRADVNLKCAHNGAHGRQVLLILRGDAGLDHRAGTRGTGPWQRRVVLLIDARRSRTPGAGTIGRARLPAGTPWMGHGTVLGKRGRLPLSRASRRIQFPTQALVLTTQALDLALKRIPLALRAFGALAQPGILGSRRRRVIVRVIRHIEVMPDPRKKYKSNHVEYMT
ncbi:MAG: hypothetical protein HYZ58_18240 [Acidobacteria bacterium]|nr:hypothetical protein [Acidobacteriota bacterium]